MATFPPVTASDSMLAPGERVPLSSFRLSGGAWGGALPIDLGDLAAVHLIGNGGRSLLIAARPNPSDAGGR